MFAILKARGTIYTLPFAISDAQKIVQETASLDHIRDSFKKIIIVTYIIKSWINERDM